MKKIFVFSKDSTGGLHTFITSLSKLKNKFYIYFYFYKRDSYIELEHDTNLNENTISYVNRLYPSADNLNFRKVIIFLSNLKQTIFIINKEKPEIIITLDYYSYIMMGVVKIITKNKTKIIATHHTDVINYINSKSIFFRLILKKILILISNLPDNNIFVSYGTKNRFLDYINNRIKCKVIYNGLDFSKRKQEKPFHKEQKIYKLITIGRLEKQKDYNTILKAIQVLISRKINVRLYILGDGSLRQQILSIINELKISKYVILNGYTKNKRFYFNKSQIFLFSSFYEGFSYSIVEAMSFGLPIIATDSPSGPSEILDHGKYGILINIKDYQGFVINIIKLIKNSELYIKYSKLSFKRAIYFSEKKMLNKYSDIINKII